MAPAAPQPPAPPTRVNPAGPPMPSFRPIILPSGVPGGPSTAPQARITAPDEDLEEGELPQPLAAAGCPASASTANDPEPTHLASPLTEPSLMPQSEVGSGEQNNSNGLLDDVNLHQVSARKRSRSPSLLDGAAEPRPAPPLRCA